MKLRLPDSVSSLQDVAALELEVRDYAKWFTHNEIKQQVHARRGSAPPRTRCRGSPPTSRTGSRRGSTGSGTIARCSIFLSNRTSGQLIGRPCFGALLQMASS